MFCLRHSISPYNVVCSTWNLHILVFVAYILNIGILLNYLASNWLASWIRKQCVFTDNFNTSPTLAHYLTTIGTCLCGTIRPILRGFQKDLVRPKLENFPEVITTGVSVDRNDQVTKLNKSKKAMRWYRKIERKLLELSIYNAKPPKSVKNVKNIYVAILKTCVLMNTQHS